MGTEGERHRPFSAVYLFLRDGGEVLLHKRRNTGHFDGYYSLVAGHVEEEESATEAMVREAEEEAGIQLELDDLEPVHVIHRNSDDRVYVDIFFRAAEWEEDIENLEPEKCAELSWFDISDLPDKTVPYVEQAIRKTKERKPFSEFGWDR